MIKKFIYDLKYHTGKTIYNTFWSKPQIKARHHPNMIKVQNALLGLWSTDSGLDDSVNLTQPLTYNDRLRQGYIH